MSPVRESAAGATRTCPHCRATILESAAVCPGCRHHLRFDPSSVARATAKPAVTPLRVAGEIPRPPSGQVWEYSVVIAIQNERGEEVSRQVVGVGALQNHEARAFALSIEVFPSNGPAPDPTRPRIR